MPCTLADVEAARERIRPYLRPTPLRSYPPLDAAVGGGIRVLVKHENHHPTNAFKVRNAFSALTLLTADERRRGVVAASRGNHGLGLAYAGKTLGIAVTVCVPRGNNPEKNAAMRGFGAEVVEEGQDYDEAVAVADRLGRGRGLVLVHSTIHPGVPAGAGTLTLEIVDDEPALDAMVVAVGGGSQAIGAGAVLRARAPRARLFGVQAAGAPGIYQSWKAGSIVERPAATFADGVATRMPASPAVLESLRQGLAGFVTVSDAEIAAALRLLLATTHNLVEGAGAAGLAGLLCLRDDLAGATVAIVLSGGNIDQATLRQVTTGEI